MIRTQIYITEQERAAINQMVHQTGQTQSEIIRIAIDKFFEQNSLQHRRQKLQQAAGLWKERQDLPDFVALRAELDRLEEK